MQAMTDLTESTTHIKTESDEMKSSTVKVNGALQEISSISSSVENEIGNIERKSRGIYSSMNKVNDLNSENKSAIDNLFEEVRKFRTTAE